VISVALQLPASERNVRLTEKFASSTSLWEILRHFESAEGANFNFTQRGVPEMDTSNASGAGRLNHEMPVLTVMPGHKEQSNFVDLQQTLSQLGFDSGSALLRLSFRNSGVPLEEAMAQISQYFKSEEAPVAGAHASSSMQNSSIPDPDQAAPEAMETMMGETVRLNEPDPSPMEDDTKTLPEPSPMDVDPVPVPQSASIPQDAPSEETENILPPNPSSLPAASSEPSHTPSLERNIQVFVATSSAVPHAAQQAFNAQDYEPTIEHAKSHQAALLAQTRNQRLLSDKELEELENARLEKMDATAERGGVVRIRMPDHTVQLNVSKVDTTDILYTTVEGLLLYTEPFQLKYMGPNGRQTLIPREKKFLFRDLRFSPKEQVTFLWDDAASDKARTSRSVLSQEWQNKAQVLKVDEPVVEPKQPEQERTLGKAEGKKKAPMSAEDKESKLKSMLNKSLFKKK
jgi:tether containing UBX domain for GLUT4